MKRYIKLLALVTMMAAALVLTCGCHRIAQGSSYTAVPSEMDGSEMIELAFWAKNDTNRAQTAVYTKAIEEFEKLYPNVRISLNLYADYGRLYKDVLTNLSTQTPPNICITYPDHIATYIARHNAVLELDDWIRDSRFGLGGRDVRFDSPTEEEMVPEFMNECRLNGHYYAVPFMRSTEALYINQDLLEKLGYELPDILTWDFVWEVSEKAMEKDENGVFKVNGQNVLIPFIYKSTDNMMITMLKQLDAPYSTEDGEILIFNDTTASLLKEIYNHSQSRAFSTFAISSYPGNFLNAGQCIFAIDSTAGATWMGGDAPMQDIHEEQLVSFRIAVRPIPQFDTENPQMISQGPSICIFNHDDPQVVLASWLFAQYLISNDAQLSYAETEGYLPVTLKAQQSAEYRDYLSRKGEDNNEHYFVKIEASQLLMNNIGNTFVTPVFSGSASLRDAAGQLVEEVAKRARRKKDLYRDINEMYQLDQIEVQKNETESGTPEETDNTKEDSAAAAVREIAEKELPDESKALLICIPAIWIGIGAFSAGEKIKAGKKKNKGQKEQKKHAGNN